MGTAEPKRLIVKRIADHYLLLATSIVLGLLNFAVVWSGYGAFWVYGFFLVFGVLLTVVLGVVLAEIFVQDVPPNKFYLYRVLLLCLVSYTGMTLGSLGRRLQSLAVRRSCDRLSELLERHKTESGRYPDTLESMPELKRMADNSNTTIREGRFGKRGGIVIESTFDDYSENPTLYLSPYHYLWLVPVEIPLPMSFTRFHAYLKSSDDSDWRYEDIGWHLAVRE